MLRISACFQHCSSCAKHGDSDSMSVAKVMRTYKDDMISTSGEHWKEPWSSTTSPEASSNGDSNEEALHVNKTRWQ